MYVINRHLRLNNVDRHLFVNNGTSSLQMYVEWRAFQSLAAYRRHQEILWLQQILTINFIRSLLAATIGLAITSMFTPKRYIQL